MIEKIHWLGHSCFRIEHAKIIYTDPYKIAAQKNKADIILITHDHYDHLSLEDIEKVRKGDTIFVAPISAAKKLQGDVRIVKPNDTITIGDVAIEAVAAYNMNKEFHPQKNGWVGYILTIEGTRIYHAGDTDVIPEMKQVSVDIALLPVGGTYTMSAQAAAESLKKLKTKIAIPMHWGTIVGSADDAEEFKRLAPAEIEIRILPKE